MTQHYIVETRFPWDVGSRAGWVMTARKVLAWCERWGSTGATITVTPCTWSGKAE